MPDDDKDRELMAIYNAARRYREQHIHVLQNAARDGVPANISALGLCLALSAHALVCSVTLDQLIASLREAFALAELDVAHDAAHIRSHGNPS